MPQSQAYEPISHRLSHMDSDTTLTQYAGANLDPDKRTRTTPNITWSLKAHKTGVIISWSILLASSLVLPLVLFFVFKYATNLDMTTILAVATALFGAPTLYSLGTRTWNLLRRNSTCRPLGSQGPGELDYFHYNFMCGFVIVTAIIIVGNVIVSPRVSALGLPFLITEVGVQIIIGSVLSSMRVSSPIVISSIRKGQRIRGGTYAITEDIIAVDSHAGTQFRQELSDRWEASPDIRGLFVFMDWAWGLCATVVGGVTIGLIFGLESEDAAWAIGWSVPWGLALVGGMGTLLICRRTLRKEKIRYASESGRV